MFTLYLLMCQSYERIGKWSNVGHWEQWGNADNFDSSVYFKSFSLCAILAGVPKMTAFLYLGNDY